MCTERGDGRSHRGVFSQAASGTVRQALREGEIHCPAPWGRLGAAPSPALLGIRERFVNDGDPSRTALAAALMRACHTRLDQPRLIDDPWGDRLVSAAEKSALCERALAGADPEARRGLEALRSQQAQLDAILRSRPAYGSVILRSRYAEDALEAAVARGARQYILIGAGFDSFIVRQPSFARDLEIFEIDHPASQAMKRERLDACAVELPPNIHFLPADLGQESLASVLARAGISRTLPSFFSWLGVTVYLSKDANRSTLHGIASYSAAGSQVVFSYIEQGALEARRLERTRAHRAAQGEPWLSGFDPATLRTELGALGLHLLEDLRSVELKERYCAGRTDALLPGRGGHVARAEVGAS